MFKDGSNWKKKLFYLFEVEQSGPTAVTYHSDVNIEDDNSVSRPENARNVLDPLWKAMYPF